MKEKNFSVLLSVYNKENPIYLDQSLKSIYTDQKIKPNEIILVKDGPINIDLENVIEKWMQILPSILRVITLKENNGLAKALNIGLKYCSNDLVARMDTDDLSTPERFHHQVLFMIKNPDIAVSSGVIEEYDSLLETKISERTLPLSHEEIKSFAKRRSPISHPACIFRKSIILKEGGYPNIYPEDYALWGKLINNGYIFGNIPEKLIKMRAGRSIMERRGLDFLKGEIKTYYYFNKIGFINNKDLILNIILKSITRLSPRWVKIILYKFAR